MFNILLHQNTNEHFALRLTNTKGHKARKHMVHIAEVVRKLVHKKQILVHLYVIRRVSLQEPCIQCDIGSGGHFVPASRCANSNQLNFLYHVAAKEFCPRNKCFRKHEHVTRGELSV